MSGIDIALSIIIVLACIKGLFDGVVKQTFFLLSFAMAVWAVVRYRIVAAEYLDSWLSISMHPWLLSALIFIVVAALVTWIGHALHGVLDSVAILGFLDHVLGLLIAGIAAALVLGFLTSLYLSYAAQLGLPIPSETSFIFYTLSGIWRTNIL